MKKLLPEYEPENLKMAKMMGLQADLRRKVSKKSVEDIRNSYD